MRGICLSAPASRALLLPPPKLDTILSRNFRIGLPNFTTASRMRLSSNSSRMLQDSVATGFYSQKRGPNLPVARAADGDGEGSEHEIDFGTSKPTSVLGAVKRIQIAVQIFVAALIYIFYFFGASAWDGKGKKK